MVSSNGAAGQAAHKRTGSYCQAIAGATKVEAVELFATCCLKLSRKLTHMKAGVRTRSRRRRHDPVCVADAGRT